MTPERPSSCTYIKLRHNRETPKTPVYNVSICTCSFTLTTITFIFSAGTIYIYLRCKVNCFYYDIGVNRIYSISVEHNTFFNLILISFMCVFYIYMYTNKWKNKFTDTLYRNLMISKLLIEIFWLKETCWNNMTIIFSA